MFSWMTKQFHLQGYLAFFDNVYTSRDIAADLKEQGMDSTGTKRKQWKEYLMRFWHLLSIELLQRNRLLHKLVPVCVWLLAGQKVSQSYPTAMLGMKVGRQQDVLRINRSERYSQVLVSLPVATTSTWDELIHLTNSLVTIHWLYCPSYKEMLEDIISIFTSSSGYWWRKVASLSQKARLGLTSFLQIQNLHGSKAYGGSKHGIGVLFATTEAAANTLTAYFHNPIAIC